MKTLILSAMLLMAGISTLTAATLEASKTQPTYPGTSTPRLTIVSGSGKTSYVTGTIGDATDPAATEGIYFNAPAGSVLTFTSSKTNVVKVADITAEEIQPGLFAVRIKPTGVGTTTIAVKLSGATDYKIEYAASQAGSADTRWMMGSCDASAIAMVGDGCFFVADDENNILRLYNSNLSGMPLKEVDATSWAKGSSGDEFDIEGATVSEDGKTIYWLTSLGNNKSGKEKPYRNRAFSTTISGSGATTTLSGGAYTTKMRDAMIAFGDKNGWNFTASASYENKMIPKRIDGFNIEGLTLQKGGGAAYVGFRAPCVPKKGVTPTSSNRIYAVLAPVNNFETMLKGSGESSVTPQTGDPVLFDFNKLGIRSIERVGNYYVIVAGYFDGGGTPAAYLWDGHTNSDCSPLVPGDGHLTKMDLDFDGLVQVGGSEYEGHPEAFSARQEGNNIVINMVCDNGSVDYYSNGNENKTYSADSKKHPWAKFRIDTFVYPLPTPTGIAPTSMKPAWNFRTCGNELQLNNVAQGTPVAVFTADGRLVVSTTTAADTTTLWLPYSNTTYVLRVGNNTVKVQM